MVFLPSVYVHEDQATWTVQTMIFETKNVEQTLRESVK